MDIDYAIRKDEPPVITVTSIQDAISLYEKWERSNRLSVMFIKTKICASIRSSVDKHTNNVKELIKAIDEQFATFDKALASTLIMQFSSMRITETNRVRDYIMRMSDMAAQLKDLEVTISDSFLVHFILYTLPNQYDPFIVSRWSINELMSMCVQEEGR
uniref:UBN2 domain-containing protein n=1 Tax=Chenopodium quinoa TaxID=63459 RepID=A0A803MSS8_CHEQI